MNHLKALGIKFLIQATVILAFLSIFEGASLANLFGLSLLITGLSYVIGDLVILPRFGNIVAVIADFGLISLAIWVLAGMFADIPIMAALASGLAIAVAEILFHTYMTENVLRRRERGKVVPFPINRSLQTEFAEENEFHHEKEDKKE